MTHRPLSKSLATLLSYFATALSTTYFLYFIISHSLPYFEQDVQAATFSIQTGYYLGDGTDNRTITGLGFQPDLILIKDDSNAGVDGTLFKTSAMSGETTARLADQDVDITSDTIQSIDSDGFTIGTNADVNTSAVMYFWIAFGGSDCTSSGTFCVGSYTGNGTSQSVNTGFQPDLAIVKSSNTSLAMWKSTPMGTNTSNFFGLNNEDSTGQRIQTLDASGFTVGNNNVVNENSINFWFIAFKEVSGAMDVGTYTGNATDNRDIDTSIDSGLTFRPNYVFVKNKTNTTNRQAVHSISEHYGDRSFFSTDTGSAPNNIQQLLSTGGFQIGTSNETNINASTYYYAAFGGASTKTAGTGTFLMDNGSYTGTGSSLSVTSLSYKPDLVIIKHNDQTTDQDAVFKTSLMIGDATGYFANGASNFAGAITSLNSDGFTVGTHATVNTSGDTYYWTAFGNAMKPDKSGGSSDFLIGSYIGDGTDNRDIYRLPIQPNLVAVKGNGGNVGAWRTSNITGDSSIFFNALTAGADYIQQINSDGFQRGTNSIVNFAGRTFFYFMFKTGNKFAVGNYTGNGTSQNVTSSTWQPDFIWVKKETGGTARGAILRTSAQSGDAAQPFRNAPTETGAITSILTTGFSVGNQVAANENTFAYQYAVWVKSIVVSITVSDGIVAYGLLSANASKNTTAGDLNDTQTVTNAGNVNVTANIKGQNTSCPWTLAGTTGTDQYKHEFSTNAGANWTALTTSYQTLGTGIAQTGTKTFDLRLTTPTSTTCGTQQNADVVVQAVAE
ncbi:MAG: hypothetical protein UT34_C0001G0020 [candidate division WS6 bacterium GW2011_GWF2_39_15]|uniref:DUF7483 domain-containing protein n=1 Tax=candidate division WS6 bacterium GW2011_GWF2_39_15 TaxID=1619100 RepID=A0A0G0Q6D0_9BACT|nr:MAG: hypothetical protein UT34_C0001G0020 [candidate division WS6 bacterium GW2011_GWF2_39_15]